MRFVLQPKERLLHLFVLSLEEEQGKEDFEIWFNSFPFALFLPLKLERKGLRSIFSQNKNKRKREKIEKRTDEWCERWWFLIWTLLFISQSFVCLYLLITEGKATNTQRIEWVQLYTNKTRPRTSEGDKWREKNCENQMNYDDEMNKKRDREYKCIHEHTSARKGLKLQTLLWQQIREERNENPFEQTGLIHLCL